MLTRFLIVSTLCLAVTGCSSAKKTTPSAAPTAAAATIDVKLADFDVAPTPNTAAAGAVTFHVNNAGTMTHELVVLKTDLAPEALPTKPDGSADEAKLDGKGEAADMPAGATRNLTLTLAPGKYVLICNVDETSGGKTTVHYKLGMRTAFTVS